MIQVDHNDCTVHDAKMCFYVRLCSKVTGVVFGVSVKKFGAPPATRNFTKKTIDLITVKMLNKPILTNLQTLQPSCFTCYTHQ